MATHALTLPDYLPLKVNDLLRMNRHARNRALKVEADLVAGYALQARLPHATGKRRVSVTFSAPGGRGAKTADPDARLKGLLDALVRCGLLVDDSPDWCALGAVECERGQKQTRIILEEVI